MEDFNILKEDALQLLQKLISIPSFSKQEEGTAETIKGFLSDLGIKTHQKKNNIWAFSKHYDKNKPTILLNSHHDTVHPNPGFTKPPFDPIIENGKLFGLGSNDAGGCLVSLIAAFRYFYDKENLKYNFVLAATAEEEISGVDGIELVLPELGAIDFALVGEPTSMDIAVCEKGLMVLDCMARGKSGHAAREEGINAIYIALKDIEWVQSYNFDRTSEHLGPVKMSVTVIKAGQQHNVIPEYCEFTIDVRVNELYKNEEILNIIQENLVSKVSPRSMRLRPSFIDLNHPLVTSAVKHRSLPYGSPTMSDQALIPFPSVKMGPGNSNRSHTADEFIFLRELSEGIDRYIKILEEIVI